MTEPLQPGQVLRKKFLEPNKCSINRFALLAGFRANDLKEILRDSLWSHSAIRKISTATNTAPRYWYHLQSAWLFHKYCLTRKTALKIEPISTKFQTQKEPMSPGYILETKFLKPTGRNYNALEKLVGVSAYALQNLVEGKLTFTPLMAYRLAKSFGTSIKYWLDLQSAYEVHLLLKSNIVTNTEALSTLTKYRDRVFTGNPFNYKEGTVKKIIHPGKLLLQKILKPSGIAIKDWGHLFCVWAKLFRNILAGKTEIPLQLMIRICRVFKIDIDSFIDMQNEFYALKAEREYKTLARKPQRVLPKQDGIDGQHPFQILINGFLKPMHISIGRFMRYIGMNGERFEHLHTGRKKIDFELAIRIGQALETGPHYWINMQLEFDIRNYEKGRGERVYHLS